MWPAFVVLTAVDALVLHLLPIAGERIEPVGGAVLAGFLNLVAIAVLAPLTGLLLRRRRRDLPRVVATDYAGTALLGAVTATLVVGGLLHRPALAEQRRDFALQAVAARDYLTRHAPPAYHRNLAAADTVTLGPDLYRTCVPGNDPERALCVFVSTDQSPPGVRLDGNRETNASFAR